MTKFKFRAEFQRDIAMLRAAFKVTGAPAQIRMRRLTVAGVPVPDCEGTLECPLNLRQVRALMRIVPDGHVMVQTVAHAATYTGRRNYRIVA